MPLFVRSDPIHRVLQDDRMNAVTTNKNTFVSDKFESVNCGQRQSSFAIEATHLCGSPSNILIGCRV